MAFGIKKREVDEAELDITSFMNLMIVLVPVLLLSMSFTKVTVLDINLPELSQGGATTNSDDQGMLEVVIRKEGFEVYYPSSLLIKKIPLKEEEGIPSHDYQTLSLVIREVKKQVGNEKKQALLLSAADVSYQTLIGTMDHVKSYKTVVAASLVEVELFPEISLGDAAKTKSSNGKGAG